MASCRRRPVLLVAPAYAGIVLWIALLSTDDGETGTAASIALLLAWAVLGMASGFLTRIASALALPVSVVLPLVIYGAASESYDEELWLLNLVTVLCVSEVLVAIGAGTGRLRGYRRRRPV